jgi:hypothetical protein
MDSEAAARSWVEAWSRGWRDHYPAVIAERYADDAVFMSHPFRDARRGKRAAFDYAEEAFAEEEAVEFRFGDPIASHGRAAVEYWAVITSREREQTLLGVTVLRFDDDGLVTEHADYWAMQDGRRPPRPGWNGASHRWPRR